MSDLPRPVKVFLSYAPEDEESCLELGKHLNQLEREGFITLWYKRLLAAGTDWSKELDEHLNTAAVILLLLSADFLASDYCYGTEMQRAMERHNAGEARVIPILLRSAEWQSAPFAKLRALPSNGRPIANWKQPDDAYLDITRGLKEVLHEFRGKRQESVAPAPNQRTSSMSMSRRQWITQMLTASAIGAAVGAGVGIGGPLVYSHLTPPKVLTEVRVLFVNGSLPTTFDPNSLKPALEETLGLPKLSVYLEMSQTYADAIDRFVRQEFNVLWGSDLAYVVIGKRLRDRAQPTPIPILQINNPTPVEKVVYYSHILTKRSSNINTIADLQNKTLAVVNKYSTSGYLYPLYTLYQSGLTTNDFHVEYTGHHLDSLESLLNGSVDACAVSSGYYKSPDSTHPDQTYANPIYTETLNRYQLTDNDIMSIKRMGPLPMPPIAVQGDLSDSDIWRLRQAFLLIDDATLGALDISGFSLVTDSIYDVTRRTARDARSLGVDVEEV